MKRYVAYCITCRPTGKKYIGVTSGSLHSRWMRHKRDSRNAVTVLGRAINAHGIDNFIVEEVAEAASWDELYTLERGLIAEHGTFVPRGFNMTSGGDGPKDRKWSLGSREFRASRISSGLSKPESVVLRRQIGLKRYADPLEREAQRVRTLKYCHTDAYREAARQRMKKRYEDPEQIAIVRERMIRRYQDPDLRQQAAARLQKGNKARWERYRQSKTASSLRPTDSGSEQSEDNVPSGHHKSVE